MTTDRSPADAVNNYRQGIQRAISCVTTPVADVAGGYYPSPFPHRLTINNGQPVALGGHSQFMFRLQQNYRVVESGQSGTRWRVGVVGYDYVIYDAQQREVLLYHWHPRGSSPVEIPHLHLEQGAQIGRAEVCDAHLPTGDVFLNAVLRVLIEEMEVQPWRPDWASILSDWILLHREIVSSNIFSIV